MKTFGRHREFADCLRFRVQFPSFAPFELAEPNIISIVNR
jgi:hypothetical protein